MRNVLAIVIGFLMCGCCHSGDTEGGGGTCHQMVTCPHDQESAACASAFGEANPDPIVCDGEVRPDGNCLPLYVDGECGITFGPVWCCGEN